MPFDLVIGTSHRFHANLLLACAETAGETLWINHVSGYVQVGGGIVERLVGSHEHVIAGIQRRTYTRAAVVATAAAAWLKHLGMHATVVPNTVRADNSRSGGF